MIDAATAKTNTDNVRTNLTYIETLVSGATIEGQYHVFIDGTYMDDSMSTAVSALGYTITKKVQSMGTYPTYLIQWG